MQQVYTNDWWLNLNSRLIFSNKTDLEKCVSVDMVSLHPEMEEFSVGFWSAPQASVG